MTERFMVLRKTIGKRMADKLKDVRQKLRMRMHERTGGIVKWLQTVVRGYFQYHAIPYNEDRTKGFRNESTAHVVVAASPVESKSPLDLGQFKEKLGNSLPEVEVRHPYPDVRFALAHPKWAQHSR